jgi:hypothetical protein
MGTITWGAFFHFGGLTWTNPASGKKAIARFYWDGAVWACTGLSGSAI